MDTNHTPHRIMSRNKRERIIKTMTTTAEKVTIARRTADALKLRLEGLTYREIATKLDVSSTQVFKDVKRALADIPRAEADTLRSLETERLDAMHASLWDSALAGDLAAMDRLLKVIDRRIKLLGLDAPQQVTMTTSGGDMEQAVERVIAAVSEPSVAAEQPAEQWEEGRSD